MPVLKSAFVLKLYDVETYEEKGLISSAFDIINCKDSSVLCAGRDLLRDLHHWRLLAAGGPSDVEDLATQNCAPSQPSPLTLPTYCEFCLSWGLGVRAMHQSAILGGTQ